MGIEKVFQLLLGLALFLYGMDVMGDALKKSAGTRLKMILQKMTSNPLKGFLLGLVVTAVIQSSSATTVMVVGFVNSGTMTLLQSVGVIMGANVGTAVTAWLTALSTLGGDGADEAIGMIKWLKPEMAWMPCLAVLGIIFIMFSKRGKKKDVGAILLGFAVLMVGMSEMSGAVDSLKENEAFKDILRAISNPILGVLAGLILTVIVQSSSASIGILQSLTLSGAITNGAAIPIIMGQNIGTCVTALLSSISANKNGKRAAMVHLYFNIIGVVFWLSVFYIINSIFDFSIVGEAANAWGVAIIHTVFKLLSVLLMAPFYKQLEKLAVATIHDKKDEDEHVNLLDDRLLQTPSIAVGRAAEVTNVMAEISCDAFKKSMLLFDNFDPKICDEVRDIEEKADKYEDALGSYLVKLSACDMAEHEAAQITKLLHLIGDLERVSDHAVNIVESAEEMRDKKIEFSKEAQRELTVLREAVLEILEMTRKALIENDVKLAAEVEPLEEVIDDLRDQIKLNHILRLQKSECSIEHGFVLSDLLTNFERVADHCSNIASCFVEISRYDALDMHKYISEVKQGGEDFKQKYMLYKSKYSL